MRKGKDAILIIENDLEVANRYAQLLGPEYSVRVLSTGCHAVNAIKAGEKFDLVLVDQNLQDMPSLELVHTIKKENPRLPVLFLLSEGGSDVVVNVYRSGADDYIKKPFSARTLIERIEFALIMANFRSVNRLDYLNGCGSELGHNSFSVHYTEIDKVQKSIQFIETNYMRNIDLNEIATQVGIAQNEFAGLFKKLVGMDCDDYLSKRRINAAKALLRRANCTMTEIALALGYEDIVEFVRVFKQVEGYTPAQYLYELYRTLLRNEPSKVPAGGESRMSRIAHLPRRDAYSTEFQRESRE